MRLAFYSLTRGALSLAAKERCVAARSLGVQPFSRTMSMAAGARLAEENRSSPKHRLPADYDSVFCLRRERIDFSFGGNKFHLDSVIQDTQPEGSDVGTVIAMHGSPGSHKDFKYVTPLLQKAGIRFIGINFPGYGYSQADERLIQDNTERVAYVQAEFDLHGTQPRNGERLEDGRVECR
uniref:AB hydrolase-1 domain-containing protein n=1 Tax=Steinernema glaseri TaxID=37863 RepID=A0A1I7YPM9_9BILA